MRRGNFSSNAFRTARSKRLCDSRSDQILSGVFGFCPAGRSICELACHSRNEAFCPSACPGHVHPDCVCQDFLSFPGKTASPIKMTDSNHRPHNSSCILVLARCVFDWAHSRSRVRVWVETQIALLCTWVFTQKKSAAHERPQIPFGLHRAFVCVHLL